MEVGVVGASGFVGSAVSDVLVSEGHLVRKIRAPRVQGESEIGRAVVSFLPEIRGLDVLVNCAGVPDAGGSDLELLMAGNAYSAEVVARAVVMGGINRLVHVSSATVQGRAEVLDDSLQVFGSTPYAISKSEGERRVLSNCPLAVVYRPPGVHDSARAVTRSLVRIASSPLSAVGGSGDGPTPLALLPNVASAISFLAQSQKIPPPVVAHPWEGLTVRGLLESMGGRDPIRVPLVLARGILKLGFMFGSWSPPVFAVSRRLELLWFGQRQGESWLEQQGWVPPVGLIGWVHLGRAIRESSRKIG